MSKKDIKFGIQIEPQLGFTYETVEKIAKGGEKFGYDSIWSSDHFFLDDKSEERNCMEAWTLLAALAASTEKIRLGTLVTCNSYRYPAVLAKIAATVDMISNGRVIFGFGAGWKEIEYNAYGIPFPPIQERMDQMEEAIQIIKLLWTEPKVTFEGKHYKIKDAFSAPKPVQKPYPPIMIGGMGKKRTLTAVAKYADYCNFFLRPDLEETLKILEQRCNEVGRDYATVGKSLFAMSPQVYIAESEDEVEEYLKSFAAKWKVPIEKLRESNIANAPGAWIGTPEALIERFQYFIDLGFDYFQIMFPRNGEKIVDASKKFAEQVMKKL